MAEVLSMYTLPLARKNPSDARARLIVGGCGGAKEGAVGAALTLDKQRSRRGQAAAAGEAHARTGHAAAARREDGPAKMRSSIWLCAPADR